MAYSTYTPYTNGFPVGYPGGNVYQPFYPPVYPPAPPQYVQPPTQVQPQYAQSTQQPMTQQPMGQAGTTTQQTQQAPQNAVQQPVVPQPPVQDNRLYVQGEAGAAAYMVPRGTVVILWDSTQPIIYIKSTDNTGRPYFLDVLDYTSRVQQQQGTMASNTETDKTNNVIYATAGELEALETKWEARLNEVRAEYKPLLPLLNGDGKKGKARLTKEADGDNA